MPPAGQLTALDARPVAGVSMANVSLLRLDLGGGPAPGNKWFKLQGSLAAARALKVPRLVSFGGHWSNHLHALAAVGHQCGFETIGIVRGESSPTRSAMLADASGWGMQIMHVTHSEYRLRNDSDYLEQVQRRFAPCLVIPEGGANAEGARGCLHIAAMIDALAPAARRVVLAVGTGTTLAGIAAGLGAGREIVGISALKGATDLDQRIARAIAACDGGTPARWQLVHDAHCGGFARVSPGLREFMLAFEQVHGIALEPVYTGKMLFAIHQRLASGEWDSREPLLAIHTGGLQGRRGFDWLHASA